MHDIISKTICLQNLKGPEALNFLFLLDQKLRSIDETCEVIEHALKKSYTILREPFCNGKKTKKLKQGTWISLKIKNQMRPKD